MSSVRSASSSLGEAASLSASTSRTFPRPTSASSSGKQSNVGTKVTDHIASTTSRIRPSVARTPTGPNPEAGILPSLKPNDNTLSKVYGSVLQPKETLSTFCCAVCSTAFPPDATIYPDPMQPNSNRFMCRPCFVENGGSKGPCGTCSRPVLTLKAEGGFIHAAGKYWHKRCFNCGGCSKNIGDKPMVDLLGHPCCPDCFDTCLKRDTPKKTSIPLDVSKADSLGRNPALNKSTSSTISQETNPILDELEQRLGVKKPDPLDDLSHRLSLIGSDTRYSGSSPSTSPTHSRSRGYNGQDTDDRRSFSPTKTTPLRLQTGGSQPSTPEDTKICQLKSTSSPSPTRAALQARPPVHPLRTRTTSLQSSSTMSDLELFSSPRIPPIPDLVSDFSDTMTQSSFSDEPNSPPPGNLEDDIFNWTKKGYRTSRHEFYNPLDETILEETSSQMNTPDKTLNMSTQDTNRHTPIRTTGMSTASPLRLSTSSKPTVSPSPSDSLPNTCAKCHDNLFSVKSGGSFVTVPSDTDSAPQRYHVNCFTCYICDGVFEKGSNGQATFVKHGDHPCHTEVRVSS